MAFGLFLIQVVFISLSGVMAPGPISAVTVGRGNQSPYAGIPISIGHAIVELPLMVAVFYGAGYLLNSTLVRIAIAFVGGILLLVMGIGMFRNINQTQTDADEQAGSPLIAGILLSAGNPYFLVWWATVGAALILRSTDFGIWGFLLFAICHLLCDLLWNTFLSSLSFKGKQFFGQRFQKAVFAACGIFLFFSSGKLVFDAIAMLLAQPHLPA